MNHTSFDQKTARSDYFQMVEQELNNLIDPATGRIRSEFSENIRCLVCDGEDYTYLFTKQGFDFVRCQTCGLVYVNPQLKNEKVIDYYKNEEGGEKEKSSMSAWLDVLTNPTNQSWQIPYFKEALDILRKYIPAGGRILDVGCSIGLFMEIAVAAGFECIGLELEQEALKFALERGLDVRRHTLETAAFPKESFDAVTMFGVLEHLHKPKEVLRQVGDCLKPGGAFMAIVPNVYSLHAMVLHEQARMFTGRNHMSYFSHKTLTDILERCGFRVKHLDTCLTGLDAVLNYWQFNNPHQSLTQDYLPVCLQEKLQSDEGRHNFEQMLLKNDLGLRLRILAQK